MSTPFHAKLFASELTQKFPAQSPDKLNTAYLDSKVDLNPHQVDAALFAFESPLSKGALLADEVGLGKTIEAGILLSQKWAEKKRRILIITPSSLRKQWGEELQDKFYLPSMILESTPFKKLEKKGVLNPFESGKIVICSYEFARNRSEFVRLIQWDLVVFDEAHRLRNVYKKSNKIANALKITLHAYQKLLLTATPLQNSTLELYGLVSFIDDNVFGDLRSFRNRYVRITNDEDFDELKARVEPFCKRTLRRQVREFIKYTKRHCHTEHFTPGPDEETLYNMVSEYLQRPELQALPAGQRALLTLVLRKLLASSSFAIAGALEKIISRLQKMLVKDTEIYDEDAGPDFEDFEAWNEYEDEVQESLTEEPDALKQLTPEQREAIENEIADLSAFVELAVTIQHNAKASALLEALRIGFDKAGELGGQRKAIIFTESTRTQDYLHRHLKANGYEGEIVLFNGTNNSPEANAVYQQWKAKHAGSDMITGSRTADKRAALVEYFRETASIMIATEAAAEGINLQFCSLVVNYDLPWNPQRIEQRIGRCHRYGQKHDVVVVNFLNQKNAADKRVYELLKEKFSLFEGVFGASDHILGVEDPGIGFEMKVNQIYQTCRTAEEIQKGFDELQSKFSKQIDDRYKSTREKLIEKMDADVARKLNVYKEDMEKSISRFQGLLLRTTQTVLDGAIRRTEGEGRFELLDSVVSCPPGVYSLHPNELNAHHYRMRHKLAQYVLHTALSYRTEPVELIFQFTGQTPHAACLDPYVNTSGWLRVDKLTVTALETSDYLLYTALTEQGEPLDPETARMLFEYPAAAAQLNTTVPTDLEEAKTEKVEQKLEELSAQDAEFFDEELVKLDNWAEDLKSSLELELKETEKKIKTLKTEARKKRLLDEKVELSRQVKKLEEQKTRQRLRLFEASDEIEKRKDDLLDAVEAKLKQTTTEQRLFTVRWRVV